jgi:hypothetical protein
VRYGDLEIIDSMAGLVRDLAWNTLPGVLVRRDVRAQADGFAADLQTEHDHGDQRLTAWTHIVGRPEGTIRFLFRWFARSRFAYPRIGISVVHPVGSYRGCPFVASGPEGSQRGRLPDDVAPVGMAADHELPLIPAFERFEIELDGAAVAFAFEGERFEMEDQRNWGDASYKTFGTPLSTPVPLWAEPGLTLEQSVRLEVRPSRPPRRRSPPRVDVSDHVVGRVPELGYALPAEALPVRAPMRLLAALRPAHLRVDLDTGETTRARLDGAIRMATALGSSLEIGWALGRDPAEALSRLAELGAPAGSRLVVTPDPRSHAAAWTIGADDIAEVRAALHGLGLALPLIAGSPGSFCELNRDPDRSASADGLAFPICPTLHAVDDDTVIANLEALDTLVSQAVRHAAGRPVHVGPVVLAPRQGTFAGGPDGLDGLPPGVDPRQATLFGAAWTAGSLARISGRGARAVTYYETHGPRGLAGQDLESGPQRGGIRPYPLYHVLRSAAARQGDSVLGVDGGGAGVEPLATSSRGSRSLMLTNLRPVRQVVRIAGLAGRHVRYRRLDASSLVGATARPAAFERSGDLEPVSGGQLRLELPPRSVAWISSRTTR